MFNNTFYWNVKNLFWLMIFTRDISSDYGQICKMCILKYMFFVLHEIRLYYFLLSYPPFSNKLQSEPGIWHTQENPFPSSIYVLVFDLLCLNSSSVFSRFLIIAILTAIMLGLKGIFNFVSLMSKDISFPYIHRTSC